MLCKLFLYFTILSIKSQIKYSKMPKMSFWEKYNGIDTYHLWTFCIQGIFLWCFRIILMSSLQSKYSSKKAVLFFQKLQFSKYRYVCLISSKNNNETLLYWFHITVLEGRGFYPIFLLSNIMLHLSRQSGNLRWVYKKNFSFFAFYLCTIYIADICLNYICIQIYLFWLIFILKWSQV